MRNRKQTSENFILRFTKLPWERESYFLYISLIITLIFSLLYFNVSINTGGDDSGYILRAMRFWQQGKFPDYQGPVYPILLAPFYGLFKGNLILLRLLSVPMFLGSIYFIYKIYRSSIQPLLYFILLLTISINFYWLNYASLTYSEAFYSVVQFGAIFFFYKRFVCREASQIDFVFLAFIGLLLVKTRSIGAVFFLAAFIYFIFQKQWKSLRKFTITSLLFVLLWEILAHFFLSGGNSDFIGQVKGLLLVDPYDRTQGIAGLSLVFERLIYNFNEYVSVHIMQLFALRKTGPIDSNWIFSIIVLLSVIVLSFVKKSGSKIIFFSTIYLTIGLLVVFITPKMWSQARFIQPFIPLLYIVFLFQIQQSLKAKLGWIPILIMTMLFILQANHSIRYAKENISEIKAFMAGDHYFEHTPDWLNYFRACEWIGKNLQDKKGEVACRKPQIAAVVAKKDRFFGIYNIPSYKCSEISNMLKKEDEGFLAINMEKFYKESVSADITETMRSSYSGPILLSGDHTNLGLFSIEDLKIKNLIHEANNRLNFLFPMDSIISEKYSYSVSFSDSLLQNLKDHDVRFMLLANLRVYENKRTDEILSSVHSYKQAIEIKYPGIFKQVYQTGAESLEPATIYEIDYSGATNEGPAKPLNRQEQPVQQGKSSLDLFKQMCKMALEESAPTDYILCSSTGKMYEGPGKNRLLIMKNVPTMNFQQFLGIYKPENNILVIDPGSFDVKQIDNALSSALLESFYGFVYIDNYMLRLHELGSKEMYKKIADNEYIQRHVISREQLLQLPEDQKKSLHCIEPSYMLRELQKNKVVYIVEDNVGNGDNRNASKTLVFLIRRKYPEALYAIKELGSSDEDRVTLYKVNFNSIK